MRNVLNIYLLGLFLLGSTTFAQDIKITYPYGGERLVAGSDIEITWGGSLPEDTLTIEYSTDLGRNWLIITDDWVGTKYIWRVPQYPSDNYLCRVSRRMKFLNPDSVVLNSVELIGHSNVISSSMFHPSNDFVLTSSNDSTAIVWDALTGDKIHVLSGHNHRVNYVGLNPSGTMIITASTDSTIKLWDFSTGRMIRSLNINEGVRFAEFNPTTKALLVLKNYNYDDRGNHISLLSTYNDLIAKFWTCEGRVWSITFNKDGSKVLVHGEECAPILYDGFDGKRLWFFRARKFYYANFAMFNPDGDNVAISIEKDFFVVNADSKDTLFLIRSDEELEIGCYSPDGRRIITVNKERRMDVWDAKTGANLYSTRPDFVWADKIEFSPDNLKFYTIGSGSVKIWDGISYEYRYLLNDTNGRIIDAEFSSDGKRIITHGDNAAKVWFLDSDSTVYRDTSKVHFSVVQPKCESRDVNLGKVKVGNSKEYFLWDYIVNTGKYDIRIDSIKITGKKANDFEILSPDFPLIIKINKTKHVTLEFTPSEYGVIGAHIYIYTQANIVHQTVIGEGTDYVDFVSFESKGKEDLQIIPNPADNSIRINYELKEDSKANIILYNLFGERIDTILEGAVQRGASSVLYNVDKLPIGTYFVVLQTTTKIQTQKLEVIR